MDPDLRLALAKQGKMVPRRFRRNQLKNLARRKGYYVVREWRPWLQQFIYRIERRPWPSMRDRYASYEYCNTDAASAKERCYVHLLTKPDVKYLTTWPQLPSIFNRRSTDAHVPFS